MAVMLSSQVSFDYFDGWDLLTVAVACAAALATGRWAMRSQEGAVVSGIRRIQTGSVNDYAGYLVTGLLVSVGILAGG